MEVHHHPDLQYKKKIFNKYFLEFPLISFEASQRFFDRRKQLIKIIRENIPFWLKPTTAIFSYHRLKPVVMNSTSTGFSQMDKTKDLRIYKIKNMEVHHYPDL
ncbi:MAG: hypothetical protein JSS98_04435 [Bacteroidetes bacterium]|nr:hypothetical protein [Bacteroidota bacterium]